MKQASKRFFFEKKKQKTFVLALLLAGCSVGPKYAVPAMQVPAAFSGPAGNWRVAIPADGARRGAWWRIFGDPQLDSLEQRLDLSNQSLMLAAARLREARALLAYQRGALFPALSLGATAASQRESAHQPYVTVQNPPSEGAFTLPVDLSYEVDLWGRVARSIAQARESAQASQADLRTASLSLHAELAIDYVELRAADAQQRLLDDTVAAYEHALRLTQNRLEGGYAPASDVAQAQTQLETTRVQATDIGVARAQYEHAIAVLIGVPPENFHLAPMPLALRMPAIPPGLPSTLLQRRPDIAAAERRVAAANQQIGIARAAYYPDLSLSAVAGFEGTSPANWFGWPSLFWSVGSTLAQPIFEGGRLQALSDQARAQYDEAVATYRQTVLTAFQQVEDNLAAQRILTGEARQQHAASVAADHTLQLFNTLYIGGADTYLQVITAQTAALANQRNDVDIRRRRVEAAILLVKALGGGWS